MPQFEFEPNGEEFIVRFQAKGEEVIGTWWNSCLYTHNSDPYLDHYFVELDPEKGEELKINMDRFRTLGAFVWRQAAEDFDTLANNLMENGFAHFHKPYPSPEDAMIYSRSGLFVPPHVIVEDEDEDIVQRAMSHLDEELEYYLGDSGA